VVHCSHRQHILDSLLLLYTARKYCVLLIVASFTRPTSSQQQGQSRRGDYNFSLAKSRPIVARCNYNASSCNLFFIVRNSGNILVKSVYFYVERLHRCDDAYFVQLFWPTLYLHILSIFYISLFLSRNSEHFYRHLSSDVLLIFHVMQHQFRSFAVQIF